ncbi:MAG: dehydrogenase [Acidobacteria bacterium 13_1_20CM_4_57_11]|nr:MAG: dehydrogenase [Acidobacteria bacterium 13_2_20CM_2_57_12]OLE16695.1 MAG: dehydrogenase [Acidobacteria bacterium 13_1_20CM_4_57_11]
MQQILLNIGTGATTLIDAPVPARQRGHVLIRTRRTLISAGTERMLIDFGRASMLDRVREQPEKVKMLFDKVRTDGLMAAIDAVRSKLDQPLALGYCNVGTVIEAGEGVTEFRPGDRVVSNGSHAGVVSVPKNLCVRIPDNVEDESAVFTVLGAIGLQGLRLAQPTLGETVAVTGLGLIGLMTVQMLRAQGCRVMGIDYDPQRLETARQFGAYAVDPSASDDLVMRAVDFSRGRGVDAVIITASTESSEPVSQAATMCRRRGRIVLVGVAGLKLSRQDFYEKEITFQVSCSYGPGRYDSSYEQKGQDYPVGFVRWTEQRNFEAVLDLMASNALNVAPLLTHRFPIERAEAAYAVLTSGEPSLGIVLEYPEARSNKGTESRTVELDGARSQGVAKPIVGCIGAGNYGGRVLIPAMVKAGAQLHAIATTNGSNAVHYGKKFGFAKASTSTAELFAQREINTVFIATRHDSHARLASEALRSGRHVYVEKPLALNREQLAEVEAAYAESAAQGAAPIILVGFNRRFSPHVQRMREMLPRMQGPKSLSLLMNAGAIPPDHWTQDRQIGGGRILGEACHFIDLARFLVGARIIGASAGAMRGKSSVAPSLDTVQISLEFEDGSIASIQYYANGHRSFPKERVEVFASGRILQLENFRVLRCFGCPGFRGFRTWRQDKGHVACVQAFLRAVESGGPSPIPVDEIFEVSRVAIDVAEGLGVIGG